MRGIAILGSTGSIGKQALEVMSLHPDRFRVTALTAHSQAEVLFEQVRVLRPPLAALTGGEVPVPSDLSFCEFRFGPGALEEVAREAEGEDVLALGAEQKASFALFKADRAFLSQHIGDLKNMETLEAYQHQIAHFERMFDVHPRTLV